jgi:hypothetical protein
MTRTGLRQTEYCDICNRYFRIGGLSAHIRQIHPLAWDRMHATEEEMEEIERNNAARESAFLRANPDIH